MKPLGPVPWKVWSLGGALMTLRDFRQGSDGIRLPLLDYILFILKIGNIGESISSKSFII